MSSEHRAWRIGFIALALLGVLILLVGITIEIIGVVTSREFEIPHVVYIVGMLFGFVGFFGLDNKRAIEGGNFIVTSAERLVTVARIGRRKTDPAIVVQQEVATSTKTTTTTSDAPQGGSGG